MTPDDALSEAKNDKLRPVYLVVGEERHLSTQVVKALKAAATAGGIAGLNDDSFDAQSASVEDVLAIVRTLPMLASRRFVLARNIESWDAEKKAKKTPGREAPSGLDALTQYVENADASAVLVLQATKLDKRKKLYSNASKAGYLVNCETPKRGDLPHWIIDRARSMGNRIDPSVADLVAELAGPELSSVADAVERLSLYAGQGETITEEAVSECVVRLRTASVWELVSAVGKRDVATSLRILQDVYEPSDRGLRLLGVLAWATRQLIKFEEATRDGLPPPEAAKAAGAPPFKARELSQQVSSLPPGALSRWIEHLAATDLALKGTTARPPRSVIEQMIMDLCRAA
jgi:DNA polymerase-3 subunit delta